MRDKNTAWKIDQITGSLNSLLKYKNKNKTLPIIDGFVLNKSEAVGLLSKIAYLCADKEWISFEEFKT